MKLMFIGKSTGKAFKVLPKGRGWTKRAQGQGEAVAGNGSTAAESLWPSCSLKVLGGLWLDGRLPLGVAIFNISWRYDGCRGQSVWKVRSLTLWIIMYTLIGDQWDAEEVVVEEEMLKKWWRKKRCWRSGGGRRDAEEVVAEEEMLKKWWWKKRCWRSGGGRRDAEEVVVEEEMLKKWWWKKRCWRSGGGRRDAEEVVVEEEMLKKWWWKKRCWRSGGGRSGGGRSGGGSESGFDVATMLRPLICACGTLRWLQKVCVFLKSHCMSSVCCSPSCQLFPEHFPQFEMTSNLLSSRNIQNPVKVRPQC